MSSVSNGALIYHLSLIGLNTASILMNCLVVLLVICFRKRFFFRKDLSRKQKVFNHNKLLISVTVGDLLVGITGVIFGILLKTGQNRFIYRVFGTIPMVSAMIATLLSLVFLTIDQLVAVKFPYKYNDYLNRSRVTKIVGLTWTLPVFITAVQILVYVKTDPETELKARNFILTVFFLAGFIILITANYSLLKEVKAQHERLETLTSKEAEQRKLASSCPRKDNGISAQGISFSKNRCSQYETHLSPDTALGQDKRHSICLPVQQQTLENAQPTINCFASSSDIMTMQARNANNQQHCLSVGHACHQVHNSLHNSDNSGNRSLLGIPSSFGNSKTHSRLSVNYNLQTSEISGNCPTSNPSSLDNSITHSKLSVHTSSICSNLQERAKNQLRKCSGSVPSIALSYLKLSSKAQRIRERRIRTMCVWIIIVFLICWLPHVGYRFTYIVGRTVQIPWFRRLSQCLALSNSLLNPCIYFLMRSDFRHMLKELITQQKEKV